MIDSLNYCFIAMPAPFSILTSNDVFYVCVCERVEQKK